MAGAKTDVVPDFSYEEALLHKAGGNQVKILGVDEAGRGPWAGPVTAGAAWINPQAVARLPAGINDSKKLTAERRASLWEAIQILAEDETCLKVATASVSAKTIDEEGILPATFSAMEQAVMKINTGDAMLHLLIDGTMAPQFNNIKQHIASKMPIIKGDQLSLSIAVAAIAAKETRDAIMKQLDAEFSGYGWQKNMGYGTKSHAEALTRQGPTQQHRLSFKPVAAVAARWGYTR